MIFADRTERTRFVRFAIVGAVGSGVDFGVMNLLTHFANMNLVGAGTISFICAVFSNFTGNRLWTYPDSRSKPLLHQLGMFFLVNLAGIAIRIPILHYVELPIMKFFDRIPGISGRNLEFLTKNMTLALAIGIVMLWNYFVNRYWTYNDID